MIDLICGLANLLLKHIVLLAKIIITFLLIGILLLDGAVGLLVSVEFISGVVKLCLVGHHLIIALFKLTMNLISSILDAFYLRLFALNISFDLRHPVHEFVERGLDLLSFSPQLLSLLPNFQVHLLKQLLFLSLESLLLSQLCLNLGIFSLNLIALFADVQLLLLVVFDLPRRFSDL